VFPPLVALFMGRGELGSKAPIQQKKEPMKKLNLTGIAAAPSSSRSTHPVVLADADTLKLLEQFAQINPQFKTLKNQSETLSKQLADPIRRMFWSKWNGVEQESSTLLCVAGGRSIKLTCKNAYSKGLSDEAPLIAAIGQELTTKYFRQATVLKLELDKMPEDCQEKFATQVLELATKLGVTDAVTATQCIQPKPGFHEARSTILTLEQNLAVDKVLPITAYPQL
jgi:hypothetical protein